MPLNYTPVSNLFLQGCRVMANRAHRFDEKGTDTPGPGAYVIREKWFKNRSNTAPGIEMSGDGGNVSTCNMAAQAFM